MIFTSIYTKYLFIFNVSQKQYIIARLFSSRNKRKLVCNYEVLGVTPKASAKDIKDAYYKKSKQYHPDVNSSVDAAMKFQQVSEAYEILSNDDSRAEYDLERGFGAQRQHQSDGIRDMKPSRFNQKLYRRMNNHHENFTKRDFESSKDRYESKADQRVKEEMEFYENLSPEMKKTYEAYLNRLKYEESVRREKANQHSDISFQLIILLLFMALVINSAIGLTRKTLEDNKIECDLKSKTPSDQ